MVPRMPSESRSSPVRAAFLHFVPADRGDDARRAFAAAAAAPVLDSNPSERRIAGGRHLNLLTGSYDSAAEFLHEAVAGYRASSLCPVAYARGGGGARRHRLGRLSPFRVAAC